MTNSSASRTTKMSTNWFVYILLCEGGSFYTGISPNPQRRFEDHEKGKGSAYTRSHKPVRILYSEKLPSKSAALKRELEIKSWPRLKKIHLLNLKASLMGGVFLRKLRPGTDSKFRDKGKVFGVMGDERKAMLKCR